MQPLIWESRPDGLRAPALVCAFTGWNDAGDAASAALQFVGASLWRHALRPHRPRGVLRLPGHAADESRSSRAARARSSGPRSRSTPRASRAPRATSSCSRAPSRRCAGARSASSIVDLAEALGTQIVVTLGALLADVPHTRPVPITGLSSDEALIQRLGAAADRATRARPASSASCTAPARTPGIPTASLWASVPHYVAAAPNPKAALALVRKLESLVGVTVDADELETAADRLRAPGVARGPERPRRAGLRRAPRAGGRRRGAGARARSDLPSGDVLAREFQRFLRQRGPGPDGLSAARGDRSTSLRRRAVRSPGPRPGEARRSMSPVPQPAARDALDRGP